MSDDPKPDELLSIDGLIDEDALDEELEMEVDDERLSSGALDRAAEASGDVDRRHYFEELFRLQGELVKLQD
jgi:hypothetical protein